MVAKNISSLLDSAPKLKYMIIIINNYAKLSPCISINFASYIINLFYIMNI